MVENDIQTWLYRILIRGRSWILALGLARVVWRRWIRTGCCRVGWLCCRISWLCCGVGFLTCVTKEGVYWTLYTAQVNPMTTQYMYNVGSSLTWHLGRLALLPEEWHLSPLWSDSNLYSYASDIILIKRHPNHVTWISGTMMSNTW